MQQSAVHEILLTRFVFKIFKYELLKVVATDDEVLCDIFKELKDFFLEPKLYLVTNPISICLGRLIDIALES
jgi:hypothetical protein